MADEQPETEVDRPVGAPRWVKVTGIVVAVLVVLFLVLHLIGGGGGQHGPGRHSLGHAPASTVTNPGDQGAPR
jgi:hypothetical protein